MLKKRLNSRIESFITGLIGEQTAPAPDFTGPGAQTSPRDVQYAGDTQLEQQAGQPRGSTIWSWETDANLNYTFCSPEVFNALGYTPQELLGKSVLTFGLHPISNGKLKNAFQHENCPNEVTVTFLTPERQLVPARIHILAPVESEGEMTGWRGFGQVLSDAIGQFAHTVTSEVDDPHPVRKKTGPLSQAGERSLATNQIILRNASNNEPATIAVPVNIKQYGELLLEIIDDGQNRFWSEDDRFLVMEVATQLALALDNAQLYQSVQQELAERVRAEQEILRRNRDLSALNQIGQRLGRLATRTEIFELLANMIGDVLNSSDLYICTFSYDPDRIEFPIYQKNGALLDMPTRPNGSHIPEYVSRTRSPLLINGKVASKLLTLGITPDSPEPAAVIAIPIAAGERLLGAIVVQDFQNEQAFDNLHVELLSTAAAQAAIALENAQAYELSQQAVAEMRELDRVKSQFLANMSHELRTPLNSIIGFSRVIVKGYDGPVSDLQKQDLDSIYNSGQHLLHLINDILDLSKIEAGKMELSLGETNLSDIINSAMSTAVGLVKNKPIQLRTSIPDSLPTVWADATRVRQVLINFLSNAAKFTDEGSILVQAKETFNPEGKREVMVTVIDTGTGIAAADQAKLFIPFSQVDDSPTRKTGGTGLGLSICRSLIDMHGGRIGLLRSNVGQGSTFFFTLPVSPHNELETAYLTSSSPAKTILAVDDDIRVINLYERYLKPHGYTIFPLVDPAQALIKAREIKPMAITLDIMMAQNDGWQVLQELKQDPETRDIPVIICSILEQQEKGLSLGAAGYLVKPFLEEDILNALAKLRLAGNAEYA